MKKLKSTNKTAGSKIPVKRSVSRFKINGTHAFWFNWKNRRVSGWADPQPKVGDELICEMESGKIALFEFTEVRAMLDPPDQYFATVKYIDYING